MKTVFKYPFEIDSKIVLELPEGAKVLKFDDQNGVACAWALVDPAVKVIKRQAFFIFGTGQSLRYEGTADISEAIEYVDSFQQHDGQLVWHIFKSRYS